MPSNLSSLRRHLGRLLTSCCFVTVLAPPDLRAQTGDAAATPVDRLRAALQQLATDAPASRWRGEVVREAAPDDADSGVMIAGGPDRAPGFDGAFQVLLDGGETLVCSDAELPGITVFRSSKGRQVVQVTVDPDAPLDVGEFRRDLLGLLGVKVLSVAATAAADRDELRVEPLEGGGAVHRFALPKTAIRDPGDDSPFTDPMRPRVLTIDAAVTLGADGALTAVEFAVRRSDPIAGLRAAAMSGEFGAGGEVALGPGDLEAYADEPGPLVRYTLRRAERTGRADAEMERMRKLLATD